MSFNVWERRTAPAQYDFRLVTRLARCVNVSVLDIEHVVPIPEEMRGSWRHSAGLWPCAPKYTLEGVGLSIRALTSERRA